MASSVTTSKTRHAGQSYLSCGQDQFDPDPTTGGVEDTGGGLASSRHSAFQRSNGEYLVFAEEDYKGKVLLYRWTPEKQ